MLGCRWLSKEGKRSVISTAPLPRSRPAWYLESRTTKIKIHRRPPTAHTGTLNWGWGRLDNPAVFPSPQKGMPLHCSKQLRNSSDEAHSLLPGLLLHTTSLPPTWLTSCVTPLRVLECLYLHITVGDLIDALCTTQEPCSLYHRNHATPA